MKRFKLLKKSNKADCTLVFENLDQSGSHRNSLQCLSSSLFSLDMCLLKSKPFNRRHAPALNPTQQVGCYCRSKRAYWLERRGWDFIEQVV